MAETNTGWEFYVFRRRNWRGQVRWFFRLTSANHKIVCQSEGYANFGDCVATVRGIKSNAARARIEVESGS